jgi:protein-S-isoprenylcysteine O-methyltransferase Ste14
MARHLERCQIEGHEFGLTFQGPYYFLRHPLYWGIVIQQLSMALLVSSPFVLLLTFVLALLLWQVVQNEEAELVEMFPPYRDYQEKVPLFWPKIG